MRFDVFIYKFLHLCSHFHKLRHVSDVKSAPVFTSIFFCSHYFTEDSKCNVLILNRKKYQACNKVHTLSVAKSWIILTVGTKNVKNRILPGLDWHVSKLILVVLIEYTHGSIYIFLNQIYSVEQRRLLGKEFHIFAGFFFKMPLISKVILIHLQSVGFIQFKLGCNFVSHFSLSDPK